MPVGDGCTVAQKTHHLPSEELLGEESPYDPIDRIVIIRNPYKTVLASRRYDEASDHVRRVPDNSFTGPGEIIYFLMQFLKLNSFFLRLGQVRSN